ncbi:MAG: hypothetical protein AB8F78_11175 [Saprospiraceae bacterium]
MRYILAAVWTSFVALSAMAQHEPVHFSQPVSMMGYASGVSIEWKTTSELDVDYYVIRRFAKGEYNIVATLEPRAIHKDSTSTYRYIDQTDFVHDLAFQLRVVYLDGKYEETEELLAQHAHSRRTRILSALDTESLARLHISLDSKEDQQVVLNIKTLGGETLETYNRSLAQGVNTLEIDYEGWPKGYYSVELSDSTSSTMQWLVHVDPSVPMASTQRVVQP